MYSGFDDVRDRLDCRGFNEERLLLTHCSLQTWGAERDQPAESWDRVGQLVMGH